MTIPKPLLNVVAVLPFMASNLAQAQSQPQPTFPSKTVTLVVPLTPSSGSDVIARIIGPKLAVRWGQSVIVDNKPGASGNLGANVVTKAVPYGHKPVMAVDSFTMAPAVYKTMPYESVAPAEPTFHE